MSYCCHIQWQLCANLSLMIVTSGSPTHIVAIDLPIILFNVTLVDFHSERNRHLS